ncbi:mucin-associated surface protein (MASP) [Trypanosoma cruzi]|nr:mucin-associated surface protein (MASP) [Trypanosoma cruzi]
MRAVRASTQPRGHVCVYCGPMYEVRVITMIVLCFACFRCPAACSALLSTSATLNASQTHSYARDAHDFLRGCTVEDGCMRTGATWVQIFVFLLFCFTAACLLFFAFLLLCVFFLLLNYCSSLCVFSLSLVQYFS